MFYLSNKLSIREKVELSEIFGVKRNNEYQERLSNEENGSLLSVISNWDLSVIKQTLL